MLAGAVSPMAVCYTVGGGGYLPADVDGPTAPLDGTQPYFYSYQSSSSLSGYTIQPNFSIPNSSVLTAQPDIGVASFSEACSGGTCVPQAGTNHKLRSLPHPLMY